MVANKLYFELDTMTCNIEKGERIFFKGKVMSNREDKGSGIELKKWSTYREKSREFGKPTVKRKWPESNYCQSQTKQNVAVNLKAS